MVTLQITVARVTDIAFVTSDKTYILTVTYGLVAANAKAGPTIVMTKSFSTTYPLTTSVPDLSIKAAEVKSDCLAYWGATVDYVMIGGQTY